MSKKLKTQSAKTLETLYARKSELRSTIAASEAELEDVQSAIEALERLQPAAPEEPAPAIQTGS